MVFSSSVTKAARSPLYRWAVGGWSFFIAENLILSENRSYLIDRLGDDGYHMAYGTLSTVACGTIGYSYVKLLRATSSAAVPQARVASFIYYAVGLSIATQMAPRVQIPVTMTTKTSDYSSEGGDQINSESSKNTNITTSSNDTSNSGIQFKVRCPFDFTDNKSRDADDIRGLDRISRHPGLWSFGFMALGQSFLTTTAPLRLWWSMPILVAWIGGAHTDSRYRRGMGGQLPEQVDMKTSNVPFLALLSGRQGSDAWQELAKEVKGLNAAIATGLAAALVIGSRGRGGGAAAAAAVAKTATR